VTLEPDDFTPLYRRHAEPLLVFFQRRVLDAELATDLMAEVFATALAHRAQYRGTSESELSGWLWAIAQSKLRDHERRDVTQRRSAEKAIVERRALTDDEIERIEELAGLARLRAAIADSLDELTDYQRTAIRLRIFEERSYEEAGRMMGLQNVAVRMHVMRALRRLSRDLRDIYAEQGEQ
jgi:RNA polymerase sigma-70 factor (ECF subfamily)